VTAHDFDVRLEADGGSRELEDLTRTFNELMAGLSKAEAESRSASLDAIAALAKALEARDVYTAGHSERVGELAVRLGEELGLAGGELEVLRLGASLHDIGKIGVTDLVLGKPTALTNEERRAIEVHPLVGARILRPVTSLAAHLPIVELHHERPDGRGYPHGLSGSAIPLPARIVHLADAYDAMTSDRPYRRGRPSAEAVGEIVRGRGTEFDADVVDAFVRLIGEEGEVPLTASSPAPARSGRTPVADSVASYT
jgi:HD-GYP domain-containing protein (c-di-GMP phosphodiesterase class II)